MLVQCEVPSIIQSNGTTENHIVFNIGCPHNAFLIDISRKAVLNGLQQIALVRMLTYRYVERCRLGSERFLGKLWSSSIAAVQQHLLKGFNHLAAKADFHD